MTNISYIKELAYKLNLFNIAKGRVELKNTKKSNLEFLEEVLSEEIKLRKASRIKFNKKSSNLPNIKFKKEKVSDAIRWEYKELMKLNFLNTHDNIFIVGECSTGKTAFATDIGNALILEDVKVSYLKYDEYINVVKSSVSNNKSNKFKELKNSEVIILDDFLYLNVKEEDLEMLYNSLLFFNEERTIIFITNRKIEDLKSAGSDTHILNTLTNRLTSNSHIVVLG